MTRLAIEFTVVGLDDDAAMAVGNAAAEKVIALCRSEMHKVPTVKVRIVRPFRDQMAAMYLDYWTNYLTIEKWAEHHGLTTVEGAQFMLAMKSCHENPHPEN